MAILRMYQGEKRKLYLSVKSEDNLPFEITSARYEVWNCDTNEKEAEGTCEIDDHVLPCTMHLLPDCMRFVFIFRLQEKKSSGRYMWRWERHDTERIDSMDP